MVLGIALLICLCILFAVWIFVKFVIWIRMVIIVNRIPGPPGLPLIGNAHQFKTEPHEFYMQFKKYHEQFPSIYRLWIGPVPSVLLCSPESAEVILNSNKHTRKAHFYTFLKPWLGDGLLLSSGDKWFSRRKLITPTFHFQILNDFLDVFNEQSKILADKFEAATKEKSIDICPLVCGCVLDALCETAMGHRLHSQDNDDNPYAKAVKRLAEILQELFKKPLYWIPAIFNRTQSGKEYSECLRVVHGLTTRVIKSRLEDFQKSGLDHQFNESQDGGGKRKRLVFLDVLLKSHLDNPAFTFNDIREEVDTFMFEGHDTTFSALSWAINIIGNQHEAQALIQKELDDIFRGDDRPATNDDLSRMSYLERVIKECLRLKPPVTAIGRKLDEDTMIDGHLVPKNVFLIVSLDAIHHNSKHWKDPTVFNPDRFLPENCANRRPFAYVPFSAGKRNCIGQRFAMMELKVVLSTLYRRFNLKSLQNGDEQTRPVSELVVRPQNGLYVSVTKRDR
ncbi:cytochrome P450 4C1-like [Antedon mediterranea]|uniref:cytochrome P450 4C1-like n=1 Tax=Antedon mediterranea TaxID=105859 RepID=UPI003AF6AEDC